MKWWEIFALLLGWMLAQQVAWGGEVRQYGQADLEYLACLVRAEAEGEGTKGMRLVGSVMSNRRWRWNDAAFSAAQWPNLEAFCRRSPERAVRASTQHLAGLLSGRIKPTTSADHYVSVALYESPRCPRWAKPMRVVKVVGAHIFLTSNKQEATR